MPCACAWQYIFGVLQALCETESDVAKRLATPLPCVADFCTLITFDPEPYVDPAQGIICQQLQLLCAKSAVIVAHQV